MWQSEAIRALLILAVWLIPMGILFVVGRRSLCGDPGNNIG